MLKNALQALQRAPLLLGAATGVLLCLLAFGLLRAANGTTAGPDAAAAGRTLCTQLEAQQYAALYASLSVRLRNEGTSAQFAASQEQLDILYGKVTSCSASVTQVSGRPALSLRVTRMHVGERTGAVTLVNEDNAWRIDSYDSGVV